MREYEQTMADLPEQKSPTAARILAAADDLLQRRGSRAVTVAEVAQKAHVGKGTVYLYWTSKADLLLGLIGRDFLELAGQFISDLQSDPDLARPSRLFPDLMQRAAHRPFVRAMLRDDDDLLGVLTDDPRSEALVDALGPEALMDTLLPSWRSNALARTDWNVHEQSLAAHSLYRGFLLLGTDAPDVLARSVTALLGPERPTRSQMRQVAADGIAFLERGRSVVLELLAK